MSSELPLPADWHWGSLAEMAEINPLISLSGLPDVLPITFLAMSDVGEDGRVLHQQTRLLAEVRSGFTRFAENDVLFAKITPCMENGKGAHARGLISGLGFGSTEFHVLRAKPTADAGFVYHVAQSISLRQKAAMQMTGSAGQQRVPADFFGRFRLPIPSFPEQRKIAHILSTVDDLIERTEALIAKHRAIKQGLMHDLLTRGVDASGRLRPPREEAPGLYRESAVGWVPREWEVATLGSVADVGNGVTLGRKLTGSGIVELPYLRVANVQDGYLDMSEIKLVQVLQSEIPRYSLEPGDMLMTEGGDWDKLGRGVVWEGQIAPCLHQNHIFRVRANQSILRPKFLEAISGSSYGKRYFVRSSKQTTNLATINSTQLKAFPVPCPSIAEQDRIVALIAAYDASSRCEQDHRAKLLQIKAGLMQDLLTGRVRVKVEATDAFGNG